VSCGNIRAQDCSARSLGRTTDWGKSGRCVERCTRSQFSPVVGGMGALQMKAGRSLDPVPDKERVANVLERDVSITISRWLSRAIHSKEFTNLSISDEQRTEYLPGIIGDLAARKRKARALDMISLRPYTPVAPGRLHYRQGHSILMIVQESRLLRTSIFETIQRILAALDFNVVLPQLMLTADEVDPLLSQCIARFMKEPAPVAVA
jgi:hypothetical protein